MADFKVNFPIINSYLGEAVLVSLADLVHVVLAGLVLLIDELKIIQNISKYYKYFKVLQNITKFKVNSAMVTSITLKKVGGRKVYEM